MIIHVHVYTLYIMFWSMIRVEVIYFINSGFRWCKLIHEWIKKKAHKLKWWTNLNFKQGTGSLKKAKGAGVVMQTTNPYLTQ